MDPRWLDWAKRLQAIAQNGLTFSRDPYDTERYEQVRAVAAEIMSLGFDATPEKLAGLFAAETGYATPKVDVRGVVFDGGRILLVRERQDGLWTLPGGWADVCESPSEAVVREVCEEAGYETRPLRLLAVLDRSKHPHVPVYPQHIYKLLIHCELVGEASRQAHEISEVAFFPEEALPELSLARVTPEQIRRCFAHAAHPEWPTDLD